MFKSRLPFKLGLSVAACLFALSVAPQASAAYPERPITLIVPWAAGGGTDATARMIAHGLQQELGQPVNVVNRTGGSGVVGHSAIAQAKPDGYTLGFATGEVNMMHWLGLTKLTYEDFAAIGQVNFDPSAVQVSADAPYETIPDLIDDIKAKPAGTFKMSGTGLGGIWHVVFSGLLLDQGVDPKKAEWIPSEGAAPAMRDLVAGGVQIVPCSLPEARSMIEAGKAKSLGVVSAERNPAFPDVPTFKEQSGSDYEVIEWRGVVGPKGMSEENIAIVEAALKKVYNGSEYQDFMNKQGYGMQWRDAKEFGEFMVTADKQFGDIMKKVGLAK